MIYLRHEQPRLLVIGHGTPSSGYGRVTYNLLQGLHREFEIHHFALNVMGDQKLTPPWFQYPNVERFDPWGVAQLPQMLQTIEPVLVLIIGERIWYMANTPLLREYQTRGGKVVLYCPIEGHFTNPLALRLFAHLDQLVVFTQFAAGVVDEVFKQLKSPGNALPKVDIIPHGLDLNVFHPLFAGTEQRLTARRQLLPHRPDLHSGMWLLNANRYSPRKHLALTLQAFAKFCMNKPADVRLVMLHVYEDDKELMAWVQKLTEQGRLLIGQDFSQPIDDAQLNLLYNACEIGINSSSSEGWGLIAFEHGATGAAQIVPKHTACKDLWQDVGLLIDVEKSIPVHDSLVYEQVSVQSLCSHMESLYREPMLLKMKSEAAQQLAMEPRFHWPSIINQWSTLLDKLLD